MCDDVRWPWLRGYGLLICDVQCHAIFLVRRPERRVSLLCDLASENSRVDPWAWHRTLAEPRRNSCNAALQVWLFLH